MNIIVGVHELYNLLLYQIMYYLSYCIKLCDNPDYLEINLIV